MSQSISLFSGYSQKENRTTNYCLLVLKMLYEENPKFLAEVLGTLAGEAVGDYVGVSFMQQFRTATKNSIPDGVIRQSPFTVFIETKSFDWFYDDQLTNHMEALREEPGAKILLALSNFESVPIARFDHARQIAEEHSVDKIYFSAVSFEDFLAAVQAPLVPKNLFDILLDFAAYLESEGLLSSWQNRLDVVNCVGIPDDVLKYNVYMCPARGGAYNHKRSQYFGMYRQKQVECVANIKALVEVEEPSKTPTVKWKNVQDSDEALISEARRVHTIRRPNDFPTRVFILDTLHETSFRKSTSGGMQSSKQYFDVSPLHAQDAADLAKKIAGRTWADLNR